MFAPATQQQQQQQQPASVTSAEEEALKRNTDCVYFLASPLTCKKGSECEYRHSEYARVNPRDCYFWLNGNCLNPKCGFRHPPLDGLLGNQGGGSTGSSVHPSHGVAASSAAHVHHNAGKQGVPCVFFQKGMCLKGDRCAFLHIPNPAANKTQQPAEGTPAAEPRSFKKPFGGLEKCTEEKKFPSANFSKAVKAHADTGAVPKVQNTGPGDARGVEMYVPQHVGYEPILQKNAVGVASFAEAGHSTQLLQTHGSDDNNSFHNGKDADDVLRESSPGFDVLVDNELGDSEYYHGEDQYGRRGQEGRNSVNEYDPDFNTIADTDGEVYRDPRGYDSYDPMQAWGQRRTSSERGENLERRAYTKDQRSDHISESDLRYRLSKNRRVNGMGLVVGHDYAHNYSEERSFTDSRRDTLEESPISSRLQGRIKLPGIVNSTDEHFERGTQRGRIMSQLSPGRQQNAYQGRFRDRIKGRLEENYVGDQDSGSRAPWPRRREMVDERNLEFQGPKSLAELKGGNEESKAQPSLRKRKSLEDHHHRQSEDSFEAPLTLSEILKRKRAAAASGVDGNKKDDTPQQRKKKENPVSTISKEESREEPEFETEEKTGVGHEKSSEPKQSGEAETEEGTMIDEGAVEDQVYEGDDQVYEGDDQNGEYYYEQGYEEDGEYNYEEGENAEGEEEEYMEEEEGGAGGGEGGGGGGEDDGGNDFAKKIGVMLS